MSTKYFVAPKEAVKVYPDGREVLNLRVKAGRQEYYSRTLQMLNRQCGFCAICGTPTIFLLVEYDHEAGRGANGGHRDDRLMKPDGKWQNAALCRRCNALKGSKRYHWNESGQYVPKEAR